LRRLTPKDAPRWRGSYCRQAHKQASHGGTNERIGTGDCNTLVGNLGASRAWAFFGVVVALAIEFAALKFGAPHKKKLDEAKELQIAQLTTEAARLSAAEKDARVAIADANARAEQDRLARVKIEARLTSVANT